MEKWLDCTISMGQFTGEFAVQGRMFNDSEFSLFAQKDELLFDKEPTPKKSIRGKIRVVTLDEKEDLLLVALPRPTLENGRAITVKAEDVRDQ